MSVSRRTGIFFILTLIWAPLVLADKTDVVELINGDQVTGEVKSLNFGELKYSTDSMGTVKIDWEDVVTIKSNQYLEVEVSSGQRFYGNLEISKTGYISVGFGEEINSLKMTQVVRITPIETTERLVSRLEGDISFGFNTSKAADVAQSNLSVNLRFRNQKYLIGTTLSSTITDQKEETTQRQSIGLDYQRFRGNRWFTDLFVNGERNDELGIDSRFSLGAGVGRYVVQNNRNELSILGGIVATRESFTGDESPETNAEGKISLVFRHRIPEPETHIEFTSDIFPLLEDLSSFRAETNLTFSKEFVEDLVFKISIYHSFISEPTQGAERSDYGVITSIGYSL